MPETSDPTDGKTLNFPYSFVKKTLSSILIFQRATWREEKNVLFFTLQFSNIVTVTTVEILS